MEYDIDSDLVKDLKIDKDNINEELMNQPLLYRKWSKILAEANRNVRIFEVELLRVKARAHAKYSQIGKKVKEVESLVMLDDDVVEVYDELVEAEELAENLKGIVVSFRQRHDSLREVSMNLRKEVD